MPVGCLKLAMAALLAGAPAAAADRSYVIIQGKAVSGSATRMSWSVFDNAAHGSAPQGDYYVVPAGRNLVITEAVYTLRGGLGKGARSGNFTVNMRVGGEISTLAMGTERVRGDLPVVTVSKRFSPGLFIPSKAEVRGGVVDLQGGAGSGVEVTFYGSFIEDADLKP